MFDGAVHPIAFARLGVAILHIIEGPVGAGKTTYGATLGRKFSTPPLVLDRWMATLFRADRPDVDFWTWYVERKARCIEQIWKISKDLLDCGHDVIVELGLLRRAQRLALYQRVDVTEHGYCIHIPEIPRDERLRRIKQRNETQEDTFTMIVSEDLFELASDEWQPVDAAECKGRDVLFVS